MKRWKFSWVMFVGTALSLGQVAMAQDEKPETAPNPEQLFKSLDKNSDGQLGPDEVSEEQRRFFQRLVRIGDKNEDGKLSSEEFVNASKSDDRPVDAPRGDAGGPQGRPNPEEMFKRLDTNGDGKLTKAEVPDRAKPFLDPIFARLGKDELTREDLVRSMPRPGGGGGLPEGMNPEEFFKRLDTNSDGKITTEEAPERGRPFVERLLERLGRGKDGSISKEEFLSAAARMQGDGRRPDGDRKPEGERRADAERKPGDERRTEDGRRPEGDRPRDGDKPREGGDRPREGDRPRDAARGPEGDRPRDAGRGPEGDRPREGDRRPEGDRPRDGGRGPEGAPGDGRGPDGGRRPQLPRFFERIDANHDGRISADELSKAAALFKDLDENGDGQLDPRELLGPPPQGGLRGQMPGDRPGQGRRPEGDRGGDQRPDGNRGEGRPDAGRPGDRGQPEGGRPGDGRGPAGGRPGGNFLEQLLRQVDKNNDGKISLDEAPDRLRERFNQLDKNGDGQIDKTEMQEAGPRPGGEGRGRRPEGGDRPQGGRPDAEKPAGDQPRDKDA